MTYCILNVSLHLVLKILNKNLNLQECNSDVFSGVRLYKNEILSESGINKGFCHSNLIAFADVAIHNSWVGGDEGRVET